MTHGLKTGVGTSCCSEKKKKKNGWLTIARVKSQETKLQNAEVGFIQLFSTD